MSSTESAKPSKLPPFDAADPLGIDDRSARRPRDPRHRPHLGHRPGPAAHRRVVREGRAARHPGAGPRARRPGRARHVPGRLRLRRASAVQYGLACLELEAADSDPLARLRTGVARHVRDPPLRVRGAEAAVAARHGGWRDHRLLLASTEPDHGSDPAWDADVRQARRRATGSSPAARCGSPTARSPSPSSGRRPTRARIGRGIRFVAPDRRRLLGPGDPPLKWSRSRASVTSELAHADERAAAGRRRAAGREGAARPAQLSEPCALRHRLGVHARGAGQLRVGPRLREEPGAVRPPDRRFPAHPGQAGGHGPELHKRQSCSPTTWAAGWTWAVSGRSRSVSASSTACGRRSRSAAPRARSSANGISLEYPVVRHATGLELGAHLRGHRGDAPAGTGAD